MVQLLLCAAGGYYAFQYFSSVSYPELRPAPHPQNSSGEKVRRTDQTLANLAVATDSRRNLEARLIEPDNEEPGIATKSADSHAEEHSLLAQSPDLPAELEGKVERLIGLWKADELELMRPKAIDLGNKPKGLDTTQKSMQFILMDIRSYLFERGQLSRSALIGVIAQVAMQLGNTERDAKLIAKKILKRAYDDF